LNLAQEVEEEQLRRALTGSSFLLLGLKSQ